MELKDLSGRFLFSAEWCGPCKAIKASLKADTDIQVIDVDVERGLVKELGIRAVPQLVIIQDGKVVATHRGEFDVRAAL